MNTKKEGNANMKNFKVDKELLRIEYRKVWGKSDRMVDYCTNQAAAMTILPSGEIITVDKQKIETRFCFGESGYDYDDAQDMAHHARTSEDYLKAENMKSLNHWVNDIEECYKDGTANNWYACMLVIHDSYRDKMNIKTISWLRLSEIIDALGGSAYKDELPGKTIVHQGIEYRIATKEELKAILDLYKYAREQHEKKVDAYIKRYGTSKVHSWTYWRDA